MPLHLPTTFVHDFKGSNLFNRAGMASHVAFAADSRLLAIAGDGRTIDLWDAYEAKQVGSLSGHEPSRLKGTVSALVSSHDGQLLASGGHDKTARLWRTSDGASVNVLTGFSDSVRRLAFRPAAPVLAAADKDSVRLFDLASGAVLPVRLPEGGVNDLAFTADGSLLAVALGGQEKKGTHPIALVNPVDGGVVRTVGEGDFLARALAFSPDGRLLAVALREKGVIQLRDTASWQVVRTLKVTAYAVFALAFSSQGVLGAALGDRVGLWDLTTESEPAAAKVPFIKSCFVETLAFSPDGRLLATCRSGSNVRVYR
jgi:WD40 repeat protein